MNLDELKAKHPDVFQAAVDAGINQERERVEAHLLMGETFNAMDVAAAAIKDGSDMSALVTAKYNAAGKKQSRKDDAAADAAAAAAAAAGTEGNDGSNRQDMGDQVAAILEGDID